MSNCYTRDVDGVWRRDGFLGIAYSDGYDTEQRLLNAVSSASRLDTFSPEISDRIVDWPSEYHLSRSRHCLLRPLGIKAGERVLELGCGCGPITRYLGEIGAEVVAVDGSPGRARIAAARCRDIRNVSLFCDDLFNFKAEGTFDWVLLVGVLEYAPMFSTMPDPVGHCLTAAGRWLAPQGRLVVAIENKLGLKYFNGCTEDHVGTAFYGIEGLYQHDTPVTFGRKELGTVLKAAGFSDQHWYYPYPDYKLPSVVLASSALACPELNGADLLLHTQSRSYSGEPYRLFNETLAMASAARNGLIADLSNSFLVVAGREADAAAPAPAPLAWSFAVHRAPRFATETTFVHRETGIVVVKTAIGPPEESPVGGDAAQRVRLRCGEAPYRTGNLLVRRVVEASARDLSSAAVATQFLPWFDELLVNAVLAPWVAKTASGRRNLGDYEIEGRFIDCVPFNMVEAAGAVHLIDEEWCISGRIPLGHVICRGLIYSLRLCLVRAQQYSLAEILKHLCAARDFTVEIADIDTWLDLEMTFQAEVVGRTPDRRALSSTSGSLFSLLSAFSQARLREQQLELSLKQLHEQLMRQQVHCEGLQAEVERARNTYGETIRLQEAALAEADMRYKALQAELREVGEVHRELMASSSWRLTAPLRAVKAGLKALAGGQRRADGRH